MLATGTWAKVSVAGDGVYKINADFLRRAGFNPDQIDPRNIKIFGGLNSMLPQPNSKPRPQDLIETAIFVSGESDGKFNSEDFILFYAQGPDAYTLDTQRQIFNYQNNLFTEKNFYFITVGVTAGKRLSNSENVNGTFPLIQQFDDFAFFETEKYNILKSGRQWFGEQFDTNTEAIVRFEISGIVPNSNVRLVSHVMAQSISDCSFKVTYNGVPAIDQAISAIPNTQYGIKGKIKMDTVTLNSTTVKAALQSTQDIKYQFTRGTTPGLSVGYLDFLLFSFRRQLALYGSQTGFTSSESLNQSTSTFEVASVDTKSIVWDVSEPFAAKSQATILSGTSLRFSTGTTALKKFTVFNSDKVTAPVLEGSVPNQDLHGLTPNSLLIITHPLFKTEAERLAAHRQSKSGISVSVVTTEQVYNEFAAGKPDFTALRDFIRNQYKKANSNLQNVLLFGRGSYDYQDRVLGNTNYVPIYESVNSLSPLETYSSDDYFALLEDHEGAWEENPAVSSTLDVGIGRLPVKKVEEAKIIVDKLIQYDTDPKTNGAWKKNILFVADDGNGVLHQSQSDALATTVDQVYGSFEAHRMFLGSYPQITNPSGQYSPEATKALDKAIQNGQGIVNYTGHGSEKIWMQEQVLTESTVLNLTNGPRYPLFVTATCEFGRNDDPFITSTAERILTTPKGGGIGLVSTARPVNSFTNFNLNNAFYNALFTKQGNRYRDLGSVFKDTKNNSIFGTANRNFSLLGDPSLNLFGEVQEVVIKSLTTSNSSSSLQPLAEITVSGEIQKNGTISSAFSGNVNVVLLDQPQSLTTLDDPEENANPPAPAYAYTERSNKLFDGSATVTDGAFQIKFTLTKNVSLLPGKSKFSFYARSKQNENAFGFSTSFNVGGPEAPASTDTTPPVVHLFVGDTTFIPGGIAAPNTKLVAVLSDASGINISSTDPQHNLKATLDGSQTFMVNNYYQALNDNPTKGIISFPIDGLAKGKHTLSLSASDSYNNTTQVQVEFVVSDGNGIEVNQFANYPNPVKTETQFWFTHNRPGEDLDATLVIYNLAGQVLVSQNYTISESQYLVTLPEWSIDNAQGTKPGPGLYIARLFVRSLLDGSNNEKNAKFILTN
ncbi:MAG: type IX secretion system sortase PorU [Bacteroidetes bacterium]|nr:type IX secretion system sortase PorU [Bacteroidota bacterium]